jgi:hypothetical protein
MTYGIFSYSGFIPGLIPTIQYAVEVQVEKHNIEMQSLLKEKLSDYGRETK